MTNVTPEGAFFTVDRAAPILATARSTELAIDAAKAKYAPRSVEEIAAHLPVPGADVADRLLELLLPYMRPQANDQQAA